MKQSFDLRINMRKGGKKKEGKQRVIFMGTGDYGGAILSALLLHDEDIAAVVTRPDRRGGRKNKRDERASIFNAVKDIAVSKSLTLLQPERIDEETISAFKKIAPDLVIVASYGRILPEELLSTSESGFVNVHASVLPKYRGASPIHNAILAGETETGTTIMQMDTGMDTGDIIAQSTLPIEQTDTTGSLFPKMAQHGADLLIETLPKYLEGKLEPKKQDGAQATLCQLIEREDGHVQWNETAEEIHNRFRALTPWPGVFSFWKKNATDIVRVKFLDVKPLSGELTSDAVLGEVIKYGSEICVRTRSGCVALLSVQMEGKKQMDTATFVRGNPDFIGARLQ